MAVKAIQGSGCGIEGQLARRCFAVGPWGWQGIWRATVLAADLVMEPFLVSTVLLDSGLGQAVPLTFSTSASCCAGYTDMYTAL
jgi:hypothetical protein